MIPKKINFIFGLDKNFCNKPFTIFHYLNILSAKNSNPDYEINVYYQYKPECIEFEMLSNFCNVKKLEFVPETIAGKPVKWKEHICGLLRVEMLYNEGGIYLDTDVVCFRSFDDLLDSKCVMGLEYSGRVTWGLCDAVILAEQHSEFMGYWLQNYNTKYDNENWNVDAVIFPYDLAIRYPKTIRMVPPDFFFKYPWDKIGGDHIFNLVSPITYAYCLHLYESRYYDILKKYDEKYIFSNNDTLSYIYRRVCWGDTSVSFPTYY